MKFIIEVFFDVVRVWSFLAVATSFLFMLAVVVVAMLLPAMDLPPVWWEPIPAGYWIGAACGLLCLACGVVGSERRLRAE